MKNCYKFLPVFIFALLISTSSITAQKPIANLQWIDTLGHPTFQYPYIGGVTDGSNFVFVENEYVTGHKQGFTIAKTSGSGSLAWQKQFSTTANDYATNLSIKSGYVYVSGFNYDSSTSTAIFNTIKFKENNGDTMWSRTYTGSYGGYDAAGVVLADASGNVYVAGTEQKGTTDFEMTLIKYDSSGTRLWVSHYDSVGLYDGAVAMKINTGGTSTSITITGFSGTGFGSWDFATATFSASTGSRLSVGRSANGSGNFSKPVGITDDGHGGFFVAGTAAVSGSQTDIKIIHYDSTFHQVWEKTWGDSLTSVSASALTPDLNGHQIVCGTITKSNGGKDIVVLSFNYSNGSLAWGRTISAANPTLEASAVDITYDGNANTYITGRTNNGTDFDITTSSFDQYGNMRFIKTYNRGVNTDDEPSTIGVDSNSNVLVAGTSYGKDSMYVSMKYQQSTAYIPLDTVSAASAFAFYENHGQVRRDSLSADSVFFYTNAGSPQLFIGDKKLSYVIGRTDSAGTKDTTYRVDLTLVNTGAATYSQKNIYPDATTNARLNCFLGYLPQPVVRIAGYDRLVQKEVYKGIDWQVCSAQNGLKYYFVVSPGESASQIEMQFNGGDSIKVTGKVLKIYTKMGVIKQDTISAYQDSSGVLLPVTVSYDSLGVKKFGFTVGSYNSGRTLVISCTMKSARGNSCIGNLCWSTYFGGSSDDKGNDIKTDASGNVFITGQTSSTDLPVSTGAAYPANAGAHDGFLAKFNADGSRAWATYYGSSLDDNAYSVAPASNDNVYICGTTNKKDLPTKNPYDTVYHSSFMSCFSNTSGLLTWGTFYGGSTGGNDYLTKAVYNPSTNEVCFVGYTSNTNWSTYSPTGSSATVFTAGEGVIIKISNTNQARLWATMFGTNGVATYFSGCAFDRKNNLYVLGQTGNAFTPKFTGTQYTQSFGGGTWDGVFLKFDTANVYQYGTYLGGPLSDYFVVGGIAVDSFDDVWICGYNQGGGYAPIVASGSSLDQATYGGGLSCGVLTVFEPDSLRVIWSTYYGTNSSVEFNGITAMPNGDMCLVGNVNSAGGATQLTNVTPGGFYNQPWSNFYDCFLLDINTALAATWVTYYGGNNYDLPAAITQYNGNYIYITGFTQSPQGDATTLNNFPLVNLSGAYNQGFLNSDSTNQDNNRDAFLARFDISAVSDVIEVRKGYDNKMSVYPNPANTALYLNTSETRGTIEIFDLLGKVVSVNALTQGNVNTIDVTHLVAGYYTIRLTTANTSCSTKFIKE